MAGPLAVGLLRVAASVADRSAAAIVSVIEVPRRLEVVVVALLVVEAVTLPGRAAAEVELVWAAAESTVEEAAAEAPVAVVAEVAAVGEAGGDEVN